MLTHTPTAHRKPARGRHADRTQRRRLGKRARLLRYELLEDRRLLSAGSIHDGPLVRKASPAERANISELNTIRIWFAEPVDPTTFGVDDVELTGPSGPITVDNVTVDADTNDTRFAIAFATQTEYGWYRLEMGPNVFDFAGNPMNQDQDEISGEPEEDQFVTSIYLGTPRISISDAERTEGDDGTTELLFTITRERDPSVAFSVDYATYNDSATAAVFAGTTSFSRHNVNDTLDMPTSVCAADLDGDGDEDMIYSAWNPATVAWSENDGMGNFKMHVIDEHTAGASSVFAADVDGDGDNDVLAASYYYDEISWHENDGSGHFTQHMIPSPADGPVFVSAADVDGDGDIDVLSASHADGRITWFENNGAESFTAHTITDTLSVPNQAIAADVDGDGDMDILTASQNDDTIAWFENDGAEDFTKHVITDTADGATSVAGHDFDGDGDMDVLSGSADDDTVAWYENDGAENFTRHLLTDDASGGSDVMIVVEDFDDDGDGDVLAGSGVFAWFENDGHANFTAHTVGSLYSTWGLATADIDGDSDLDVLSVSVSDMISWYENSLVNPVPADYEATSGTLAFAAGELEKTIPVTVFGDADIEPDEAMYVTISISSEVAQVADSQGIGTILNDDEPIVLFEDSFEHGQWNGLWVEDSQNDWFTSTQRKTDGNYSAEVDGRATDATLTMAQPVDMTPYGSAELTFDWFIERGLDKGEYLALDFSPDGSTWTEIARLSGNVDTENTWHNETIDVDPAYLTDGFKIRFRGKMSSSREDADVDNVKIIATSLSNQPPTAGNDTYSVAEDQTLTVVAPGVLANDSDPDGDTLTAALVSSPSHGVLTLNTGGSLSYTPDDDFHGGDSFTYQASDGTATSNTATVTITVTPENDVPVAHGDAYTVPQDTPLNITAPGVLGNDTDIDGDTLQAILVTDPTHGSVTLGDDGSFEYTPEPDYVGEDSFTYKATDTLLNSDPVTVAITVTRVNHAPVATSDAYSTDEDNTLTVDAPGVLGNDTDADGDSLIAILVDNTTHGTLTLNVGGSFTYVPDANFNGTDTFTYKVNDTIDDSNVAMVTITVNAINDAPVAGNDTATTDQNMAVTIDVLANDTDVDGDSLTTLLATEPAHGTVVHNTDESFTYTPATDYFGEDSFTYLVSDGNGGTNTANVALTVNELASGPMLVSGIVAANAADWTTVDLDHSYTNMVVVATPNYTKGDAPMVVRIQNALDGGDSFEVKLDRADGKDGSLEEIFDVHYMVVEEGVYTVAKDGVKMEAVKFTSTRTDENNSWVGDNVGYQQSYSQPVVVGQVMSYNDPRWSVFWARGSSRTTAPNGTLYVGKTVAEDPDNTRAAETIGYIVIEAGQGTIGTNITYEAGLGADSIRGVGDSPSYDYSWSPDLPDTVTAAVASQAGMDGGNGGWAVLYGNNPASVNKLHLAIDEDQMKDTERRHTTEQVAYIVFDPPAEMFAAADTNQDGHVTPLDALLVINRLNTGGSGQINADSQRLDVNRDGTLTPADALWIINDLNQNLLSGGEGESTSVVGGAASTWSDRYYAQLREHIFADLGDGDTDLLDGELLEVLL